MACKDRELGLLETLVALAGDQMTENEVDKMNGISLSSLGEFELLYCPCCF